MGLQNAGLTGHTFEGAHIMQQSIYLRKTCFNRSKYMSKYLISLIYNIFLSIFPEKTKKLHLKLFNLFVLI